MKKTLMEMPEIEEGRCYGCVFHICEDPCYPVICQRFFNKNEDCKGKIFILKELKPKRKRTSKSK